jgi:hypothetical protein
VPHQAFAFLDSRADLCLHVAGTHWFEGVVDFLPFAGGNVGGVDLVLIVGDDVFLFLGFFLLANDWVFFDILLEIVVIVFIKFLFFCDLFSDFFRLVLMPRNRYLGGCGLQRDV